jgi:hypothetical protein
MASMTSTPIRRAILHERGWAICHHFREPFFVRKSLLSHESIDAKTSVTMLFHDRRMIKEGNGRQAQDQPQSDRSVIWPE